LLDWSREFAGVSIITRRENLPIGNDLLAIPDYCNDMDISEIEKLAALIRATPIERHALPQLPVIGKRPNYFAHWCLTLLRSMLR
jgi:hypothetical protein